MVAPSFEQLCDFLKSERGVKNLRVRETKLISEVIAAMRHAPQVDGVNVFYSFIIDFL